MKYTLTILCVIFHLLSYSQQVDPSNDRYKAAKKVSFITKVDIANLTKDGIYMNGYVVNMDSEEARKLNGKLIRVTGKVKIVKGLDSQPKQFNENGQEIIKQGRSEDTRHIFSPKIKIIGE